MGSWMGIRARALLIVIAVIAVIGVVSLAIVGSLAVSAVQQRERLEVQESLQRANEAVVVQVAQLRRTAKDWAVWDDSYQFMQDRNQAFVQSNLTGDALEHLGVDLIAFIEPSGKTATVVSLDTSSGLVATLPSGIDDVLGSRPELVVSGGGGVLSTPSGPLLVAVEPIMRSDASGPSVGALVIGKYLRQDDADLLSRASGAQVSIISSATAGSGSTSVPGFMGSQSALAGVVVPESANLVSGFKGVSGLDGVTGLVLKVTQPRTTMILARRTGAYLLIASIIATGALMIWLAISVDRVVTQRLERLSQDVRAVSHEGDLDRRVGASGNDEIAALAEDINVMLDALQESRKELEYMAGHDALTGLYNRRRFETELGRELLEQTRSGGRGAVMWFDLDNFKDVNDGLGHAVGDRVLEELSQAVKSKSRAYSTFARVGGDEFALVLPNADHDEAQQAAGRLLGVLRERVFRVEGHSIKIRVSIGIALYPDHGSTLDEVLVSADKAMYEAKRLGGDRYEIYDEPPAAG